MTTNANGHLADLPCGCYTIPDEGVGWVPIAVCDKAQRLLDHMPPTNDDPNIHTQIDEYEAHFLDYSMEDPPFVITPDYQWFHVPPPKTRQGYSLDELRDLAQCRWVELVSIPRHPDWIMVVDEEGRLKVNPHINVLATQLALQPIVGTVLVCLRKHIT